MQNRIKEIKVIVMESSLKRQLKHSYKNINKGA